MTSSWSCRLTINVGRLHQAGAEHLGSALAELLLRGLALALLLAGAETLHGMARLRWLVPRLGGRRAQRVSIVSGSLLAFLLVALALPSLPLLSRTGLLLLGIAMAAFMVAYDVALGRWFFHRSWRAVFQDFNPFRGNLLVLGVILLILSPLLASALSQAIAGR